MTILLRTCDTSKQSVNICYINSTIINLNVFTIHLFVHSRFFIMLVMFLFATYPQEHSCVNIQDESNMESVLIGRVILHRLNIAKKTINNWFLCRVCRLIKIMKCLGKKWGEIVITFFGKRPVVWKCRYEWCTAVKRRSKNLTLQISWYLHIMLYAWKPG